LLQQEIYFPHQEFKPCFQHDKQWLQCEDHRAMQTPRIQILGCFLKEKICSVRHSLPFTMVPGIMVVHMVLHIIKFVNGFPRWGGVKHFLPGEIMTDSCIHDSNFALSFGTIAKLLKMFCHETVSLQGQELQFCCGSGNLSGSQVFLALDTGHTIIRHQWVALPMPPAVIEHVNVLGRREPAILTFPNWLGRDIGDSKGC
jgi:hypothetical protein